MIPRIAQAPHLSELTSEFLTTLQQKGFTGDISSSYADRLTMATDNSIYQLLPQAVVFPRTTTDVTIIARIVDEPRYHSLSLTPRGGGTGTNGQALTDGIVVDLSRHMKQIIAINPEERWVKVEAGVIKDELNLFLKPFGFFFAPELSTSNRATLGGMINTDASGQGSMVYGKTSDHVLAIKAVLLGGDILETQAMDIAQAEAIAQKCTQEGKIYQTVLSRCQAQRALILAKFPKLNRFLTGYDLRHVLSDDMQRFDLTRILTGSEGTLAFITEAKLDITPIPKQRSLVNVKYDAFDSALRNAPFLVQANALSVETVDSKVLNLAREDIVWHSVNELITDVPNQEMLGLNIVEFAGDDKALIAEQVSALCQRLDSLMAAGQGGVIGYQICHELADINRIYAMRKKAVGLLGNAKGQAKPIPFVEDTCVPPEHLADYITEFRALLDGHQLDYGMFGHVDAGVLHVRPALDMCSPQQEVLMKSISDEIVALTAKYGGLLWGEHGKGFRAQYSPEFFGETLYNELRAIKTVFDPRNRLNPGKICPPLNVDEPMKQVDAIKRGTFDSTIPLSIREHFRGAMACNGNGLCFNFDVNSPMCPSMKITGQRIHSPKGRATLVREWLRLLAEHGIKPQQLELILANKKHSLRGLIAKTCNTWKAKHGEYDFSHEVKAAMNGCLACKACSTQCPIKIDVPSFRAKFTALYHQRYWRPLKDYVIANVEYTTPLMAKAPKLFNFFIKQPIVQSLTKKTIGMVDLPLLSSPTLTQQLVGHRALQLDLAELARLSDKQRHDYVLVIQDAFTSYYDAKVVADFIQLIEKMGFKPLLLPFLPNGKAQHVKGFLAKFSQTAKDTAKILNRVAKLGIPMVGVDPALVLCYRDEYQEILANTRGDFQVKLVHEWLSHIDLKPLDRCDNKQTWYLFGHCTEVTALPQSMKQWQSIFAHYGQRLEYVNTGCCGMAGTYGHELDNYENSLGIYQLSWAKALTSLPLTQCLSTGYSCRSQVKRIDKIKLKHPLQALLEIIK